MATHWKAGGYYYFYEIIKNDGAYELTIELNGRIVKQKKSSDDKWLRAYAKGYIDFLYSTKLLRWERLKF